MTALAIGKFDGMHVAHQALFEKLGDHGAVLAIDNNAPGLTPGVAKQHYVSHPIFTCALEEVRELEGNDFIAEIVRSFPSLEALVVGYDFRFGRGRQYCADDLPSLFHGAVYVVEEIRVDNLSVHSGIIRELVANGDITRANRLLARPYSITGEPIKGQGLGSKELVPTINLSVSHYIIPIEGVYATRTILDETIYDSVTFIGHRVSTDRKFSFETHLLDVAVEPTPEVEVRFYGKLRDNKKYDDLGLLNQQIVEDIECSREFLAGVTA